MTTLGLIVANRGFFPDHLCETGRKTILDVLDKAGIRVVALPEDATTFGAVETLDEARKCSELFKAHKDEIDGVLVTLPNFGDERAVANILRWSELNVPVLVHAFADDPKKMDISNRRDSFCGKISVCNNLNQYGIPFSLTTHHAMDPEAPEFKADLQWFCSVCGVVRGLKNARFGALGARPAPFNTVRFSEKILEESGISIETIDLSELLGWAKNMTDDDKPVKEKIEAIQGYTSTEETPNESLVRMAKLGAALDKWIAETELKGVAIQCWTALEEFYGVAPCTLMSMLSNSLTPAACEVDVGGLIGMYAMQCASETPSALLDWNNNYGDDPDKGVMFHCSNLPASFFSEHKMDYQAIIAGTVGKDNTYGTVVGRIKPESFTFCRVSTDDVNGFVQSYVGEGRFTDDPVDTFGGYAVYEISRLQRLLAYICENGFEHHIAVNLGQSASAIEEAFTKYLGWPTYHHTGL